MDESASLNAAALGSMLAVLTDARDGVYDERVSLLPEGDPLAPLGLAINALLDELEAARRKSVGHRREMEQLRTMVELQRATIRMFSTPLIEVWRGVLCLPLVGDVSTERGEAILSALLSAVVSRRSKHVIIDVTGVAAMATGMARWLIGLSRAVRLLGARCVITGIQGELAAQLTHLDLDLEGIETHSNVREALEQQLRIRSNVTR